VHGNPFNIHFPTWVLYAQPGGTVGAAEMGAGVGQVSQYVGAAVVGAVGISVGLLVVGAAEVGDVGAVVDGAIVGAGDSWMHTARCDGS